MATTKVSTKLLETVGVAEGGTGATSTSAARTSLGLVIGTNVLAPNGSGSSLTGIATGATDAEATNIMLNSFRISVNGGLTVQNMVDGVVDEFEDETGVDTGTSTNEVHDATGDFYSSPSSTQTTSTAASWTDTGSNFTIGTGTIGGADDNALKGVPTFNGVMQVDYTITAAGAGIAQTHGAMGFYPISEDATWTDSANANMAAMTNSYYMNMSSGTWQVKRGSSTLTSFSAVDGDVVKIERNSSNQFKVTVNGVLKHTYSTTNSTEMRLAVGGHNSIDWSGVSYIASSTVQNVTLVSNATTALAAPDDANIVIWQQDVDAITLNTDLKAYASRNGGTTYTQMTLSEVANLTTGRILTGSVDISGQSSATAMKYKIETLNTKEQKIHAVALQWS